ncbi:MAG: GTPase HflX [Bacteroidales bacterium]|nr:GTPase HflX [Bacteroidales bacterium]
MLSTDKELEKVVVVAVRTPDILESTVNEHLDELEFLAETAEAVPVKRFVQSLTMPDNRTYVGSGKLLEIAEYLSIHEDISTVIFDDELSPSQLKNIERTLKMQVLDRTSLILLIFARRARTAHAKTQVELAQYQYMLPRLTRMWTHLERQRGGINMRGPGETELETDRRIIRDIIAKLKEDLKKIDRQMATQRKNRGKLVRVALVGYTNVGKSTLMNALSKSEVFAENKLFATLDTTVRKVVIGNLPFLLTDTVGFIRKLPHHLVESFKSTLDEVREADILLHVVDISHSGFEEQIEVVSSTLREIDDKDKPTIMVFNKVDAFSHIVKDEDDLTPATRANLSIDDLKKSWMAKETPSIFISALNKGNFDEFKEMLYKEVMKVHVTRFPYNDFLYTETGEEDIDD